MSKKQGYVKREKSKKELQLDMYKDYEAIKLEYPICTRTKNGTTYFRYTNRNTYECVTFTPRCSSLTFGTLDRDYIDNECLWLKYVTRHQTMITENEYMDAFNQIITDGYAKFLEPPNEEEQKQTTTTPFIDTNIEELQRQLLQTPSNDTNYDAPF